MISAARPVCSSLSEPTLAPVAIPCVTEAAAPRVQPVGMTDEQLVHRSLNGEDRAFATLIDRHAAACLRFATRMLGDRADAQDVAQETFFRVFKALAHYDARTPFRSWLFAILVNRCRTLLVQRTRRVERVVADEERMMLASVPSTARATEVRADIDRALRLLVPEQREAFLLRHVEGLEYDEIARLTDTAASAVRMRVKRACDRLQELMADEERPHDHS
jgi:RNA polymerase sigma-70 factor (ECF subfamily)